MGDEEDRSLPLPVGSPCPIVETFQDPMLGRRVQRRGGFVEDEDPGVFGDGPGDGQPLALARRQFPAPVPEHRVETVRQAGHVVVDAGYVGGLADLLVGGIRCRVAQVVADAQGEEYVLLQGDRDVVP